jgi:hypothetical protein
MFALLIREITIWYLSFSVLTDMIFNCKLKKNVKYTTGIRKMLYELKDEPQKNEYR